MKTIIINTQKEFDKINRKGLNEMKNHHPYCQYTYFAARVAHINWRCLCDLLRSYDRWREEKQEGGEECIIDTES